MGSGQHPKYETSEEMQILIDKYFKETTDKELTLTGLALALDFESRQSIYHYEKKETFCYTIKKARLRIEHSYEKSLRKTGHSGDIFALKNFGWRDKQEIDLTHGIKPPDLSDYTDEELDQLEAIHRKHSTF